MLRLILGEDWIANRNAILEQVTADVKGKRAGSILLVPEQISHEMERRLCAQAGDTASRYAEVLSFTRLSSRVFAQVGGGARKVLDAGGRIIAMAAAVEQLRGSLKVFAAAAARPEFLTQMISAIDEFKSCCVTSSALRYAAGRSEGVLAQKLEELSLLLEAYDAICGGNGQDPRDRMTQLLEQLEASDFGEKHKLYIDGFSDFTAQERGILAHLIGCAPEVTVSLVCREPKDGRLEFETAGETAFALLRMAEEAGVKTGITVIPGRQDGGLRDIRKGLLSGQARYSPAACEAADAVAFPDIWQECTYAAQEILRLAREENARFGEITLVCGDFPGYRSVLNAVFHRYGIPTYFSGTEDILHKSVIFTVLTAVDAAVGGLEQETVLRYCKSVLSPLAPEECDKLENYALMWGIEGRGWTAPWKMHPNGLGAEWDEKAEAELAALNQARDRAIAPLAALQAGLEKAGSTAEQLRALTQFLREIRLAERMDDLAAAYEAAGERQAAQEMEQLWEILVDALEQMDRLLGQSVRDGDGFLRLLRLLLCQYDVGTIPAALDQVTAGAVSDLRRRQGKYVFILGAEEGKLPPYASSGSVLTESERETLVSLGVSLSGSLAQQMSKELAGIHAVVSAATKRLYFTTGGGQGAFLWKRLCAILGWEDGRAGEQTAYGEPWEAASRLAASSGQASAEDLGILPQYLQVRSKAAYDFGRMEPDTVRALYGEKLRLSASQIDKLAECRFAYFMRYGLRAQERKPATVDPAQFGTFVHYVLEHTARDVEAEGGFREMTLDRAMEIAQGHMDTYTKENFSDLQARSQREDYLYRRNLEEVRCVVGELWQELRQSQFRPRGFEVYFGRDGEMPPVELKGRDMDASLLGFVDRVDLCTIRGRDYVRVVDYKTGKKDFDYCDILNGIGLQMLLYLFALEQGGARIFGNELKPAGVLYFPARMPLLSVDGRQDPEEVEKLRRKELRRKGMVLKDEETVRAMEPGDDPVYLPCKRNKVGELVSGVATPRQWEALRDYIYDTVGTLIDQVSGGSVEPNPYYRGPEQNACRFCEYRDACHLDACGKKRPFRAVGEKEFWEQIGGEQDG